MQFEEMVWEHEPRHAFADAPHLDAVPHLPAAEQVPRDVCVPEQNTQQQMRAPPPLKHMSGGRGPNLGAKQD